MFVLDFLAVADVVLSLSASLSLLLPALFCIFLSGCCCSCCQMCCCSCQSCLVVLVLVVINSTYYSCLYGSERASGVSNPDPPFFGGVGRGVKSN